MFNESIKKTLTLTFDSWTSIKKTINSGLHYQLDIGSSVTINSLKYLKAAHQAEARAGPANKANNIAILDHLDVGKDFVEIDGIR